jgi:hypothetical protein
MMTAVLGCGDGEAEPSSPSDLPPDPACPAGAVATGDGCVAAGVMPEQCAPGFEADGLGGCQAVLPAEACPDGWLALPGETACRPVADCGAPPWGPIETDATTQHVDASYAGADSDGTAGRPWTTIQQAVDQALPCATVAVAEGNYPEDVSIAGKAVRLWGRCPSLVELVGQGGAGVVDIRGGADGTEVRGLALRGPRAGLFVSGATDVHAAELWIHDAGLGGVVVLSIFAQSSLTLSDSLVERASHDGVAVFGAEATVERTVVRASAPQVDGSSGWGITVGVDEETDERSYALIRETIISNSGECGLCVHGSTVDLSATVVRDTMPSQVDATMGYGIVAERQDERRSQARIVSSVVERNSTAGMLVSGSDAVIDATVIRATQPRASDLDYGLGVVVQRDFGTGVPSHVVFRGSLIDDNRGAGIYLVDAELSLDRTLVRNTSPSEQGSFGDGLAVESAYVDTSCELAFSRVQDNARAGLALFGARASLAASDFACNTIHIDGEASAHGSPFEVHDAGGNRCGCLEQTEKCRVLTSNLDPPQPIQ